jgi:hypothetical protein
MGGGQSVKQTNVPQATAANAGATSAANTASGLSSQYNTQQQQQYNNLFGANGKSGAVGSQLNPANLNPTAPTGAYALANTAANTASANQYAANKSNITSNAQQAGFGPGTPAGFVQDQQNQNSRALANTTGQNFLASTQAQQANNTSNFWNAANMSQAQGTAAQGGALQGNNTANQTYSNLYGTAGKGNVVTSANYLAPIMGAAGTIGSAALGPAGIATNAAASCCAEGTLVRTGLKEFTPIEKLFEGATVFGLRENDEDPIVINRPLAYAMRPCVRIKTDDGRELICSTDHTLLVAGGGYASANESLDRSIRTRDGLVKVVKVTEVGERRVVRLYLEAPHVFESNGLLSEE